MPKLRPQIERLRYATYQSVEMLLDKGKHTYEKDALYFVFSTSKRKKKETGFTMITFDKFYTQYRDYKRRETSKNKPYNPQENT